MKILFLRSNPRKNGFSENLFDLFVKGAKQFAEVTDIDLTKKDIHPCKGCFHCWTHTPGICIQNDDMKELLNEFLTTDILVFGTPLYAFAVSSYCKIFQERTLPLLAPGVIQSQKKRDRNYLRFPEKGPKKMAALIVGGLRSEHHSEGVLGSLQSYADGFGLEYAGALVRTESYILQFNSTKPKSIKNIETAFYQAGQMLANDQSISEEVQKKAALPLAPDAEYFQRYSNIYWNYALQVCQNGGIIEDACTLTNRDITILMYEMARSIDCIATKSVKANLYFDFQDIRKNFLISINRGTSSISENSDANADLIIRCKSTTWAQIILREIEPLKAFTSGEISLTGDKELFRKLHRYFPPPST